MTAFNFDKPNKSRTCLLTTITGHECCRPRWLRDKSRSRLHTQGSNPCLIDPILCGVRESFRTSQKPTLSSLRPACLWRSRRSCFFCDRKTSRATIPQSPCCRGESGPGVTPMAPGPPFGEVRSAASQPVRSNYIDPHHADQLRSLCRRCAHDRPVRCHHRRRQGRDSHIRMLRL